MMERAGALGIGVVQEDEYDASEDRMVMRYSQDMSPIFDRNRELQWSTEWDGYTPSRDLKMVASIPMIVVQKWLTEEGVNVFNSDHWPIIKRKLNDPAYRYLRTGGGRV